MGVGQTGSPFFSWEILWRACMVRKDCLSRQAITQKVAHSVIARHLISPTWVEEM